MVLKTRYIIIFVFLLLLATVGITQGQLGIIEAESGKGAGEVFWRSNASGSRTKHFDSNQPIKWSFTAPESAFYSFTLRYSNDNYPPPTETVQIKVDNQVVAKFLSVDTGDFGNGWNGFTESPTFTAFLPAGLHTITLSAQGGDKHGIEADRLTVNLLINGKPAIYSPDERINWQYGDLYAVLYRAFDSKGQPALHVYCAENGIFTLSMIVTEDNMENEMQAEQCAVNFYIIGNQIQVNIHFDAKLYEVIADDLRFIKPVMRYFDPNE